MDISQYAKGQWYHRKFDVSMLATTGWYSNGYLSQDTGNIGYNGAPSNNPGTFNALFDNIVYTDSSGNIVYSVFSNDTTMKIGSGVVIRDEGDGDHTTTDGNPSWVSSPGNYPLDNYVWVIDGWKVWTSPSSGIVADGISTATVTAYVWTPDSGSNTKVYGALIDFKSDREQDIIEPVTVSLNSYAITDWNGNAYARIKSTKAGPANITVYFGHWSKIVTVNFIAGSAARVNIEPDYLSLQTGVEGTLTIRIEDQYGNFVSDSRGITVTSNSSTMLMSKDNGITWSSQLTFDGINEKSILIKDTVANIVQIQAEAPSLQTGYATIYINNAPAAYLEISPLTSTVKAGEPYILTIQAKDQSGNNASSNASIVISSASSSMEFSLDKSIWYSTLNTNLNNGTAYVYYRDIYVGENITITADASGMTIPGKSYATIIPNDPAILDGWADRYSVSAGESVTITAKITDIYGNPIENKWVSFTPMVQSGKTQDAYVTPGGNSTNSNGEVTTIFTVSTDTSGSMNYCVINSEGLLGKTITISAGGVADHLAFLPSPMSLGADKIGLLFVNVKDGNGYNTPAPTGHENIHIYADNSNVLFSNDNGNTWHSSITVTVNASGEATVNVKCHYEGSYMLTGEDIATSPLSPASTTLTVTTGYFLRISPSVETYADAGADITITVQIIDQNGNTINMQGVPVTFSTNNGSLSVLQTNTDNDGKAFTVLTLSIISDVEHIVTAEMTNPDDTTQTAKIISQPVISFAVTGPSEVYRGYPFGITVRAKDAYGQTIEDYTGTVTFSSTDSLAQLPSDYTFTLSDQGIKVFEVTLNTNGIQKVSVTDTADTNITGESNNILVKDPPTATVTETVTPTITPTLTPTPTITQTVTETNTQTVTPTVTNTITSSVTPTITETITETATPTITQTVTETITQTATQTNTPTVTQTVTETITQTATQTNTPTVTQTVTQTITQTVTETITQTVTQTNTQTATWTITPSKTSTATQTITPTVTPSATLTITQSNTLTITYTNTQTITQTNTQTVTQTITSSITETITPSFTETNTFTITLTHTNTPPYTYTATPTITGTYTITETHTITDTITPTITLTITYTETFTVTRTHTLTMTHTITLTATATNTETHTETQTDTITETVTPSVTSSITYTFTVTTTDTITPTFSITETYTITPTITKTLTYTVTPTDTVYLTPTITLTPTPTPEYIVVYPNPYNREKAIRGTLKIEFLPQNSKIRIYTIDGYLVYEERDAAGHIEWDGKNKKGEKVSPGIYIYIIDTEEKTYKGKIYIIK